MIRSRFLSSLGALCLAAISLAGPLSYGGKSIPIRAGVLITTGQTFGGGIALNSTPHVFGQLESDYAIKPAGWTFENPHAQTVLNQSSALRWAAQGPTPAAGTRLTKRDAPYWEVNLDDASNATLDDYDVLLLSVSSFTTLNTIAREKLRRFTDGGGVLWVDLQTGGSVDPLNPVPIAFDNGASGGPIYADPNSPLLSTPNRLTVNDLYSVTRLGSGSVFQVAGVLVPDTQAWIQPDFLKLQPVVGESGNSIIVGYARLGDGLLLVTSRSFASFVNEASTAGGFSANTGFTSGRLTRSRNYTTCAKLTINAITLASQYNSEGQGSRKTNSIPGEIPAPVSRRFTYNQRPAGTSAALSHGLMFITTNNSVIALDAKSNYDRDGDGNPDDGVADPMGSEVDVIWVYRPAASNLSSPTVAELPRFSTAEFLATTVVLVHGYDRSGVVYQLNALTGALINTYPAPTDPTLAPAGPSAAPVVHDGLAFVADTRTTGSLGRVWVIDLATNSIMGSSLGRWAVQGAQRLGAVSGGVTVGYIPILDNSGGMDRVVYVPMAPGFGRTAGLVSLWLGARGESPSNLFNNGVGFLQVTTRAALQNLPIFLPSGAQNRSLGVKISVRALDPTTKADLGPIDPSTVLTGVITQGGQNGVVLVGLTAAGGALNWTGALQNAALRMDYTIDWGAQPSGINATSPESFVRGDLQLPDDGANAQFVAGNIALADNGNLFLATTTPDTASGGSFYALRELGRGEFRMLYRWQAYDAFTYSSASVSGGVNLQYDPSVIDYDGLLSFGFIGTFLDRAMTKIRIAGGPAVRGGKVYLPIHSGKNVPFLPGGSNIRWVTTMMAFKADPKPPQVRVEGLTSGNNFAIIQPDIGRSNDKVTPNVLSVLQPQQFEYVRDGRFGKITLQSMTPVTRGRVRDAIINNLPFVIRRAGQPDIVVEPELDSDLLSTSPGTPFVAGNADGSWSPQVYQWVTNGLNQTSAAFLSGDVIYYGGGSYLPRIFNAIAGAGPFDFSNTDGLIYAFNTRVSATDIQTPNAKRSWMSAQTTARPWQPYVSTFDQGVSGDFIPSPYVLMPQAYGTRTFDDYRIRLRQAVLNDNTVVGMAGGEGALAVWGGTFSYLFARGDFVVADESRVLRVDSVGNPIWTTDATANAGDQEPVGGSARVVSIGRPSRAYATSDNGLLIADPDNNRIVEVDAAGKEVRTIGRIKVDPNYSPDGTPPNPTLALSRPHDVLRWTSYESAANNPFTTPSPDEYWVHHLIADTGNSRVVELVDRYEYDRVNGIIGQMIEYVDPNSSNVGQRERALGVLNWQTRSELSHKRYAYNSLDRAFYTSAAGTRPLYCFGFSNSEPTEQSFGLDAPGGGNPDNSAGAGGIVLYDPGRGATKVISEFDAPAIGANVYWNDATLTFNSPAIPASTERHILGLKSVTMRYINLGGTPTLAVMFCDNTGVYELVEGAGGSWSLNWMFPREAYRNLRFARTGPNFYPSAKNGEDFQPTFARRLDSTEVLLTNGYVGRHRLVGVSQGGVTAGDPFTGEVLLLDGSIDPTLGSLGFDWNKPNFGFNNNSVNFELPPVQGARRVVAPAFADKR